MHRDHRRQNRPIHVSPIIVGLVVQLFSQLRKSPVQPPVTIALLFANIFVHLSPYPNIFGYYLDNIEQNCIYPRKIVNALMSRRRPEFLWNRLLLSSVIHADDHHLYYNMLSLCWKGIQLEMQLGSPAFAFLVAYSLVVSHSLLVVIAFMLDQIGLERGLTGYDSCAVGFSAVLFSLKYVLNYSSPDFTVVMGIRIPTKFAAWLELILASVITPNASFLGHFAGILAGLTYVHGAQVVRRVGTGLAGICDAAFGGRGAATSTNGGSTTSGSSTYGRGTTGYTSSSNPSTRRTSDRYHASNSSKPTSFTAYSSKGAGGGESKYSTQRRPVTSTSSTSAYISPSNSSINSSNNSNSGRTNNYHHPATNSARERNTVGGGASAAAAAATTLRGLSASGAGGCVGGQGQPTPDFEPEELELETHFDLGVGENPPATNPCYRPPPAAAPGEGLATHASSHSNSNQKDGSRRSVGNVGTARTAETSTGSKSGGISGGGGRGVRYDRYIGVPAVRSRPATVTAAAAEYQLKIDDDEDGLVQQGAADIVAANSGNAYVIPSAEEVRNSRLRKYGTQNQKQQQQQSTVRSTSGQYAMRQHYMGSA